MLKQNQSVVLASSNAGKLREFSALLAPLGLTVIAQSQLGVTEAEEPHPTFIENALTKARHAARSTGLPALADDSGLCVPALHGAPGVYSARFAQIAGQERSDAANRARLLDVLTHQTDRGAYFYCALVYLRSAEDPQPLLAEGRWHGTILPAPRGTHGFGYDPLFQPDGFRLSAAELDPNVKNTISHRALAFQQLMRKLESSLAAAGHKPQELQEPHESPQQ